MRDAEAARDFADAEALEAGLVNDGQSFGDAGFAETVGLRRFHPL